MRPCILFRLPALIGAGLLLNNPAHAMDACAGSYAATLLRPLASPLVVGLDLTDNADITMRLGQAFTNGLQDAGVSVGGAPDVLLRLSYQVVGQGSSTPGGPVQVPYNDPNTGWSSWSGGQAAALQGGVSLALPDIPNTDMFNPQQSAQSGLLMLRVEARNQGIGTPAWIATLQCTLQTTDSVALARQLGVLIGGAIGKQVSKAPV